MAGVDKEYDAIGGQFLATTIHELRTPIQTISGSLELLSETSLTKEQSDFLQQIRFSSDVLLTLVNDLLDISKIRSGKFSIESVPINIVKITEQTVELLSPEAHNRQLEVITDIDYTIPASILGDPTRIKQILINLIKNAIKFTPTGYIQIVLSQRINNSTLLFEVRDSGIGISKSKQHKIFTDFYQVDASITRNYGGTGLGLSISKSLVDAMGGRIGMKSQEGKGSVFWFSIPIYKDENYSPRSLIENRIKLVSQLDIPDNSAVLIVDDQKLSLQSLHTKLKTLKFNKIDGAISGQQALKKMKAAAIKKKPYTIVFVDLHMSKMSGIELAQSIRKDPILKKTKCFLMIPDGKAEIKKEASAYFEGHICKPIMFRALIGLLSDYFNVPSEYGIIDSVEELPRSHLIEKSISSGIAASKKVLIAEDHPINQKLMQTFVSHFGATTISASNGKEAIECIKNDPSIDMIFMDIHMPILSGVEASKAIREFGFKGPIIACTANSDIEEFESYKKNGMNGILTKPFKRKEIGDILKQNFMQLEYDSKAKTSASTAIKTLLGKNETKDFWDWNDFMDTVGGDISLGKELILQYITQTSQFLNLAKESVSHKDFVSLTSIGHTLKGSSATLSLGSLTRIGSAIERAGKNKDMKTITLGLKTFSEVFENFKMFVQP